MVGEAVHHSHFHVWNNFGFGDMMRSLVCCCHLRYIADPDCTSHAACLEHKHCPQYTIHNCAHLLCVLLLEDDG